MASIELCKVVKAYGQHQVIKPLDLKIEDGSFTVLVGPSGCGKSTLLRLIAGLDDISDGDAYIGSNHINHIEPAKRDVAMVFQSYALYPHLTVEENIAFHMKSKKVEASERQQKVAEVARILGIEHLLKRYPKDLSGGQRQRVAMGRAMVRKPKVFLFDEPLSNLDAQLRMELRAEIKAMHQELRSTMVYVTHDQIEAMTLADQIVVMKDGVIVQQGAPLTIYDEPANTFVARFIGSPPMNLIPGTLKYHENAWTIEAGEIHCKLMKDRIKNPEKLMNGQKIQLGFRPNHVKLTDNQNHPSAKIHVLEITGDSTLVHAKLDGHKIYIQHAGRLALHPDNNVFIQPEAEHIHLFDEAGMRL